MIKLEPAAKIWALYWRYLLFMALLLPAIALCNDELGLMAMWVTDVALWPTAFWSMTALLFAFGTLIQNKGLVYLFFGKRIQSPVTVWRKFNLFLILLFITLALFGLVVPSLLSPELWALYKLYGQSALLLFWPLFAACFVVLPIKAVQIM